MVLSYVVTDVFTDTAFGGNQLAVVFGAEDLSTEEMLNICRECKERCSCMQRNDRAAAAAPVA